MAPIPWPLTPKTYLNIGLHPEYLRQNAWLSVQTEAWDDFHFATKVLEVLGISAYEWAKGHERQDIPTVLFMNQLRGWHGLYYIVPPVADPSDTSEEPDKRPWVRVPRLFEMAARLDAQHGGSAEPYDISSDLFRIVDYMLAEFDNSPFDVMTCIEGRVPEDMIGSTFLERLPTWTEVYHENLNCLGYGLDNGIMEWPDSYHGPRTYGAAFLLVAYHAHNEFLEHYDGINKARLDLRLLLVPLMRKNVSQLLANWLTEYRDELPNLKIPEDVIASPGIFQIILKFEEEGHAFELLLRIIEVYYEDLPMGWVSRTRGAAIVDALPTVDIATISREDMCCPYCWADFDEDVKDFNNKPMRVPCCGRLFGRDCLVDSFTGAGTFCPMCRKDIVDDYIIANEDTN